MRGRRALAPHHARERVYRGAAPGSSGSGNCDGGSSWPAPSARGAPPSPVVEGVVGGVSVPASASRWYLLNSSRPRACDSGDSGCSTMARMSSRSARNWSSRPRVASTFEDEVIALATVYSDNSASATNSAPHHDHRSASPPPITNSTQCTKVTGDRRRLGPRSDGPPDAVTVVPSALHVVNVR